MHNVTSNMQAIQMHVLITISDYMQLACLIIKLLHKFFFRVTAYHFTTIRNNVSILTFIPIVGKRDIFSSNIV